MRKLVLGSYRCLEHSLSKLLKGRQDSNPLSPVAVIVQSISLKNYLEKYILQNIGNTVNIRYFTLEEFIEQSVLAYPENFFYLPRSMQNIIVEDVLIHLPKDNYFTQIDPQTVTVTVTETLIFLKKNNISSVTFHEFSQKQNQKKMQDFSAIYSAYEELLDKKNLVDFEKAILLQTEYFLSFSGICLYGFYEHSACEYTWRTYLQKHPQIFCYIPFRSFPFYNYTQSIIKWHYQNGFEVYQAENIERSSLVCNFFSQDSSGIHITMFKNEVEELYDIPQTTKLQQMNFAIPANELYLNGLCNTLNDLNLSFDNELFCEKDSIIVTVLDVFIHNFSKEALRNLIHHRHFCYQNFTKDTFDNIFEQFERFFSDEFLEEELDSPQSIIVNSIIDYLVEANLQLLQKDNYRDYIAILSRIISRISNVGIDYRLVRIVSQVDFIEVNHNNAKKMLSLPLPKIPSNSFSDTQINDWQSFVGTNSQILAVLGATNNHFPSVQNVRTIFNDDELTQIQEDHNFSLPSKLEKEKLLLCLLFDSTNEIIFSYPRKDFFIGKELQPCSFLNLIIKFEQGEFYEIHRSQFLYKIPRNQKHTLLEYDLSLHTQATTQNDAGALSVLHAVHPQWKKLINALSEKWQKEIFTEYDGVFSTEQIEFFLNDRCPSKMAEVPAHFLETYAHCPYQFFVKHFLRVTTKNTNNNMNLSNWQKKNILLRSIRKIQDSSKDNIRKIINKCFEQTVQERDFKYPMIFEIEKIRLVNTIEKYIFLALNENTKDFFISYKEAKKISVTVDINHTVCFSGKIDQVNTATEGDYGIQYHLKDTHKYKNNCFYGGTQLQLPTELLALVQQKYTPTHVEHRFIRETGDYKQVNFSYDTWQDTYDKLQKICYLVCHGVEKGFFAATPNSQKCRNCSYTEICGPHRNTIFNMKNSDFRIQFYDELSEIE
ncbi:PD-(D/E)XK nuclease family protein [Candidatus Uabimicrobium sp. HlEnr_7]|uniref:PD-(D/E)XK nuclease family protein n=1 Tax=Candidatus Uabimicrobium helgolandensis TaxID=3095367 RepID=UPI003556D5E4